MENITHAPLFAGLNGFGLAANWLGWVQPFHCEIDDFCQKVINYYWPKSKPYYDIRETDFTIWRGKIDVLSGGFPCQPYSTAGKRLGKEDDRHLWPEMLRSIREIQPGWVVGENVRGIANWNGGMVFEEVQVDLEAEGYEVQSFMVPACAVNAPHRRERIWFIAYSQSKQIQRVQFEQSEVRNKKQEQFRGNSGRVGNGITSNSDNLLHQRKLDEGRNRREATRSEGENQQKRESSHRERVWIESITSGKDATDSERIGQSEQRQSGRSLHQEEDREWKASWSYHDGRWPTQPPVCSGDDGLSERLDGITLSDWREESIKGFGNAIVPEVAYQHFKVIDNMIRNKKTF